MQTFSAATRIVAKKVTIQTRLVPAATRDRRVIQVSASTQRLSSSIPATIARTQCSHRRRGITRAQNDAERPSKDDTQNTTSTATSSGREPEANSLPSSSVSKPATSTSEWSIFQDASFLSKAFGFLSATSALIAFPALLAPQLLLDPVFHSGGSLNSSDAVWILEPLFLRVAGATLLISAAVEYCLMDAAANSRLSSPTYARLMAGCSIKSMLYLTSFASLPELWSNPLVCLAYLPTASASLILNSGTLLHSMLQDSSSGTSSSGTSSSSGSNGEKQASPLVLRIGALFAPSSLLPKSPLTLTYTLLVLLYLATAAACWLPEVVFVLPDGAADTTVALLLKRTWAPGFWLAAVACVSLGDAAERGRLGASTFRSLHSGLICLELSYSILLAAAIATNNAVADTPTISSGAGAFGIAVFAGYQLYAHPNPKKAASSK